MTIVADVRRPDMTAREEASTIIEGPVEEVIVPSEGEGAGVGYGLIAAVMLFIFIESVGPQSDVRRYGRRGRKKHMPIAQGDERTIVEEGLIALENSPRQGGKQRRK